MIGAGGIDVGGTKIEARLFSDSWEDVAKKRIETPRDSYENLLDAIEQQFYWLLESATTGSIPIGIGLPGLVDQKTGQALIANLPANGQDIRGDLGRRFGNKVWFANDCRAFALSEAKLGAGQQFETVLGLVLGTGVAAGFVTSGNLVPGHNGAAGEIGHLPIPAAIAAEHELRVLDCGCGRKGCYETMISGPGMTRLAKLKTGISVSPETISKGAIAGDARFSEVMDIWAELTVSLIQSAILIVDPDCIVLGGGLSNIPEVENLLMQKLPNGMLNGTTPPPIKLAQGGDSSGARGAALVAHRANLESVDEK